MGTDTHDMEIIRRETKYVAGLPVAAGGGGGGGGGDASILTGLGLYMGMKACAKEVWGIVCQKSSLTEEV